MRPSGSFLAPLIGLLALLVVIAYILLAPIFNNSPIASPTPEPTLISTPSASPEATPTSVASATPSASLEVDVLTTVFVNNTIVSGNILVLPADAIVPLAGQLNSLGLNAPTGLLGGLWRELPGVASGELDSIAEAVLVFPSADTAGAGFTALQADSATAGYKTMDLPAMAEQSFYGQNGAQALFIDQVGPNIYVLRATFRSQIDNSLFARWAVVGAGNLGRIH